MFISKIFLSFSFHRSCLNVFHVFQSTPPPLFFLLFFFLDIVAVLILAVTKKRFSATKKDSKSTQVFGVFFSRFRSSICPPPPIRRVSGFESESSQNPRGALKKIQRRRIDLHPERRHGRKALNWFITLNLLLRRIWDCEEGVPRRLWWEGEGTDEERGRVLHGVLKVLSLSVFPHPLQTKTLQNHCFLKVWTEKHHKHFLNFWTVIYPVFGYLSFSFIFHCHCFFMIFLWLFSFFHSFMMYNVCGKTDSNFQFFILFQFSCFLLFLKPFSCFFFMFLSLVFVMFLFLFSFSLLFASVDVFFHVFHFSPLPLCLPCCFFCFWIVSTFFMCFMFYTVFAFVFAFSSFLFWIASVHVHCFSMFLMSPPTSFDSSLFLFVSGPCRHIHPLRARKNDFQQPKKDSKCTQVFGVFSCPFRSPIFRLRGSGVWAVSSLSVPRIFLKYVKKILRRRTDLHRERRHGRKVLKFVCVFISWVILIMIISRNCDSPMCLRVAVLWHFLNTRWARVATMCMCIIVTILQVLFSGTRECHIGHECSGMIFIKKNGKTCTPPPAPLVVWLHVLKPVRSQRLGGSLFASSCRHYTVPHALRTRNVFSRVAQDYRLCPAQTWISVLVLAPFHWFRFLPSSKHHHRTTTCPTTPRSHRFPTRCWLVIKNTSGVGSGRECCGVLCCCYWRHINCGTSCAM